MGRNGVAGGGVRANVPNIDRVCITSHWLVEVSEEKDVTHDAKLKEIVMNCHKPK